MNRVAGAELVNLQDKWNWQRIKRETFKGRSNYSNGEC